MSIRSLLQIILSLMIIIIIGGIYFIYFYTGPLENNDAVSKNRTQIDKVDKDIKNSDYEEILEETSLKENKKEIYKNIDKAKSTEIKNVSDTEYLTKNIEYVSSNNKGEIFKIVAEFGRTNLENSDILNLENVKGTIISTEKSKIYISSKFADYNYSTQNSSFYKNVKIKYDDREISCDNLDLNISNNIAVAYNNVIMKDKNSSMKAQKVTMDILTKNIIINSKNEIKIISN